VRLADATALLVAGLFVGLVMTVLGVEQVGKLADLVSVSS